MFGRNLISLTWVIFCFFLLSCSFFFFSNVNLPKSMILQTGGSASSAIPTTSSPSARACAMADGGSTTPSWAPSEPISRTCWKRRMNSLMGEFFVGGMRGPPLKNARVISSLGLGALVFRWRSGVPGERAVVDRALHHSKQFFDPLILELAAVSDAEGDRARSLLLLTHDEEGGNFLELAMADLRAQLFALDVVRRAQPGLSQLSQNLLPVFVELLRDRNAPHLLGREPEREVAARVLDEDAEETLERAEDGAMEDHRAVFDAILRDVVQVEELRQVEVALDGAELPRSSKGVVYTEVDLRSVERTVARRYDVRAARRLDRRLENRLGSVPNLVGTDPLLGPEAEGDVHVVKLERAVDLVQETEEVEHLAIDAFRRGEDVRVILRKGSDSRQPLRDSRFLIPVEPREVGVPHGQVPVAPRLRPEQEAVARAVHRLDAELALVDLDEEHVLAVSAGVARCPEELLVENLGRDDLLVAVLDVELADPCDQEVVDRSAFRQEERRRRGPGMEEEEPQLLAELAVVARFRGLEPREMLVQLLLREKDGPVNALEHRVFFIALPVRARRVRELEDAELAG